MGLKQWLVSASLVQGNLGSRVRLEIKGQQHESLLPSCAKRVIEMKKLDPPHLFSLTILLVRQWKGLVRR